MLAKSLKLSIWMSDTLVCTAWIRICWQKSITRSGSLIFHFSLSDLMVGSFLATVGLTSFFSFFSFSCVFKTLSRAAAASAVTSWGAVTVLRAFSASISISSSTGAGGNSIFSTFAVAIGFGESPNELPLTATPPLNLSCALITRLVDKSLSRWVKEVSSNKISIFACVFNSSLSKVDLGSIISTFKNPSSIA